MASYSIPTDGVIFSGTENLLRRDSIHSQIRPATSVDRIRGEPDENKPTQCCIPVLDGSRSLLKRPLLLGGISAAVGRASKKGKPYAKSNLSLLPVMPVLGLCSRLRPKRQCNAAMVGEGKKKIIVPFVSSRYGYQPFLASVLGRHHLLLQLR